MVLSTYTGKTRQVSVTISGPVVQTFAKHTGVGQKLSHTQVFDVPVEQGRFDDFKGRLMNSSLVQFYTEVVHGKVEFETDKVILRTDDRGHYYTMHGHLNDFCMAYVVGDISSVTP